MAIWKLSVGVQHSAYHCILSTHYLIILLDNDIIFYFNHSPANKYCLLLFSKCFKVVQSWWKYCLSVKQLGSVSDAELLSHPDLSCLHMDHGRHWQDKCLMQFYLKIHIWLFENFWKDLKNSAFALLFEQMFIFFPVSSRMQLFKPTHPWCNSTGIS